MEQFGETYGSRAIPRFAVRRRIVYKHPGSSAKKPAKKDQVPVSAQIGEKEPVG
jgi:hypothetical protein